MLNHVPLRKHDQIRFGLIESRWDVISDTRDGRYVLVVNRPFETYQVIDREQGFRGALTGGPMVNPRPVDGPSFDIDSPNDHARHILNALEDGEELAFGSLMPLWIERHWTSDIRGPILDPEKLSDWACHRVQHWLKANGLRWIVGSSAVIHIRGRYAEFDAWTIRNSHQAKTLWPRCRPLPRDFEPYQKPRTLRLRVPLSHFRKA